MVRLIKMGDGFQGLLMYLRSKHMHPDHKENWNIKLPGMKDGFLQTYANNYWNTNTVNAVIDRNFTRGGIELQEILEMQASKEGRENDYGDIIYDNKERQLIEGIEKATIDNDEHFLKQYKEAQKIHKSQLFDHYKKNKEYLDLKGN